MDEFVPAFCWLVKFGRSFLLLSVMSNVNRNISFTSYLTRQGCNFKKLLVLWIRNSTSLWCLCDVSVLCPACLPESIILSSRGRSFASFCHYLNPQDAFSDEKKYIFWLHATGSLKFDLSRLTALTIKTLLGFNKYSLRSCRDPEDNAIRPKLSRINLCPKDSVFKGFAG